MTDETKKGFLALIKKIKLDELVIPNEANRKWYKFGAYDALQILSKMIEEL